MIITKLMGGLGNQLFQYAAGRSLAIHKSVPLKLDTAWFEKQSKRNYRLSRFRIAADVASPTEVAKLTGGNSRGVKAKIARYSQYWRPYYKRNFFKERYFYFDPLFFNASPNTYLSGYWTSEKYFRDIADVIRSEFIIDAPMNAPNREVCEQIGKVDAISLHVRRGDYVNDPTIKESYGICEPKYYFQALALLVDGLKAPHVFVFSDDVQWVQNNLTLNLPVTFVSHNGPEQDYEDLRLMMLCKYHIIANSTFSWWGAWLSPFREKIVVAPKHWYHDLWYRNLRVDTRDLIPENWIQL